LENGVWNYGQDINERKLDIAERHAKTKCQLDVAEVCSTLTRYHGRLKYESGHFGWRYLINHLVFIIQLN
jgi:hypothetical protein